jgi:hypothetical protein
VSKTSWRQSGVTESLIEAILSEPELDLEFARQQALFTFINYMRFPRDAAAINDSSLLCMAKYMCEFVVHHEYARSLSKTERCDLLIKFSNPVDIIDLCLSERIINFHFIDYGTDSFTRTVADIVRFLISYNPESDHFRDQASIKKAHFFFANTEGFAVNQMLGVGSVGFGGSLKGRQRSST